MNRITHTIIAGLIGSALLLAACKEAAPLDTNAPSLAALNEAALADDRRVLDLEGGVNFRDLGGYHTADGRVVKWEMLYRSGSPAGLTANDMAELNRRGIRSVCDLRSSEERAGEPSPFAALAAEPDAKLAYFTRDYEMTMGDLGKLLGGADASPESTRAAMTASYADMPGQFRESFAEMFQLLAQDRTPLAFNCSAGKDRTGIAAALILTALGVPRETVLADYAMSDKLVDYRQQIAEGAAKNPSYAMLAQVPFEIIEPLMKSDPPYLAAALDAIERQHGSVDAYLEQELGVTPEVKQRLRDRLSQPAV